jgi:hypothetical protein
VRAFVNGGEALYREILSRQHRGDLEGADKASRRFVQQYPHPLVVAKQSGNLGFPKGVASR